LILKGDSGGVVDRIVVVVGVVVVGVGIGVVVVGGGKSLIPIIPIAPFSLF
jgi:hypothetical protein